MYVGPRERGRRRGRGRRNRTSTRQEAHEGRSGLEAGRGPTGSKAGGQGIWAGLAPAKAVNEDSPPGTPCQAGPAGETGREKKHSYTCGNPGPARPPLG